MGVRIILLQVAFVLGTMTMQASTTTTIEFDSDCIRVLFAMRRASQQLVSYDAADQVCFKALDSRTRELAPGASCR